MDSLEEIFSLTFAVQRINGVMNELTAWMAGRESSEFSFEDRAKLAVSFFVKNPQHILLGGDHLNLVRAVETLTRNHADFLARKCEDSTEDMRQEARDALIKLADITEGLGYSRQTAEHLRALAGRT